MHFAFVNNPLRCAIPDFMNKHIEMKNDGCVNTGYDEQLNKQIETNHDANHANVSETPEYGIQYNSTQGQIYSIPPPPPPPGVMILDKDINMLNNGNGNTGYDMQFDKPGGPIHYTLQPNVSELNGYNMQYNYTHGQIYSIPPPQGVMVTQPTDVVPATKTHHTYWLVPSVLVCLFCFWPTGLFAIMYSSRAKRSERKGDFAGASSNAQKAKTFVIVSIVLGVLVLIVYGIRYSYSS
ncbi:proline-rich transmembrane protein 1-like [Saccostrea cucullata]|uniref:proline-rich transmembrane protein 1-like n=1 Tax=Saccostrea cuccullata TaxID=36930 RepID=UPI002ED1D9CB